MEEAKQAVKDFTSQAGKHDTTVHEVHKPAITHTHVTPTQHVENQTVVDKEVHQHHHHTSVQPIHHKEVLPEQHHHKAAPVEHKEVQHGDHNAIKDRLAAEAAQFKDVTETGRTEHTHEAKSVVTGTHVHHHVHETIQPIIQKETIQPTVIHTTIPIHEVHHNEPKHHAATALPAMGMEEFKKRGGSLTGAAEVTDRFEGEPQSETAGQHGKHGGAHLHGFAAGTTGQSTASDSLGTSTSSGAGIASSGHPSSGTTGSTDKKTIGAADGLARNNEGRTEHDRNRHALEAGAVGAGAAGVATHETRNQDQTSRTIDPRVDSRVDPTTRGTHATENRAEASRAADGIHSSGKLHKDPPSQYADTHAGSKMDTVGDRGQGLATTSSDGKPVNPNVHNSNFEAANVSKSTAPPTDDHADGTKKRSSLLERITGH